MEEDQRSHVHDGCPCVHLHLLTREVYNSTVTVNIKRLREINTHSSFGSNECFLSDHTLIAAFFFPLQVFIYSQETEKLTYTVFRHFFICFSPLLYLAVFLLSSCPLHLSLRCQPVIRNLCCSDFSVWAPADSVDFHVCCSLNMSLHVNNQKSLYSANLFPVGGIMFWM